MITVVGEALVDLVGTAGRPRDFTALPGGSPANVAVGLGRLGQEVVLATHLGDDTLGHLVRGHLEGSGVVLRQLGGAPAPTSLAIATVDGEGRADYDFRITWDVRTPPPPGPGCLAVHTGSLAAGLAPGADAVEAFLAAERARGAVTLSLDPNVRPSLLPERREVVSRVERQVAMVDVVKVSAEDLGWLYPGVPDTDVARRWLASGPGLVVVTLGRAGAYGMTAAAGEVRVAASPVDVVDTVGAGDAFTAGLLDRLGRAGLLGGDGRARLAVIGAEELRGALRAASGVAALTCTRRGAEPPTRAEVDAVFPAPPPPA
ncbi:carbohydrate kinase [Streptomyces sp. MUM 203J]|uniref:carbohydrate kinase family protein n=1 Tax=Streptomyces sp. MUM 203J TaxID=2791990 RepID=UPI001F04BF02|nr:carbohydrate kinase [Streptomyces sp. MUM 203J]MCH0541719.1 carbohydrate kinase [Streptomyces sp. MUM 203J]